MQQRPAFAPARAVYPRLLFLMIWLSIGPCLHAQYYEERPQPEIGFGIKLIRGSIMYGPKSFYTTDKSSVGLQALFRYDYPIHIHDPRPFRQYYINLVVESGFIFSKAHVFDTVLTDPVTGAFTHEHSKRNPVYFPVYLGFATRNKISVGTSLFYWKGLGTRDLMGIKYLALSYNAPNYRISVSGEWYTQARNSRLNGNLISIDFWWKLFIDD